jgi:hypothetical protein
MVGIVVEIRRHTQNPMISGRKLVNCDPNYAFAADLPCRPQPCFTAVFTPIVFTDFVRVIGSITSPALVDTFGVHSAADAFIVFHCFPSGCRTLRSYLPIHRHHEHEQATGIARRVLKRNS